MGGQTPDRAAVTDSEEQKEQLYLEKRRLAMVQLAMGGPTFLVLIFGLVVAYRVVGRPLGDAVFWTVLGTLIIGFAVYAGYAVFLLRKTRR